MRQHVTLECECIDRDFAHRAIFVRDGKGGKDRVVTLPEELVIPLERHLENRRTLFEHDARQGYGTVYLPHALARKYPNAPGEWGWQYVFPSSRLGIDPRSGVTRRHHLDESASQLLPYLLASCVQPVRNDRTSQGPRSGTSPAPLTVASEIASTEK